jgi:hypothetical protein
VDKKLSDTELNSLHKNVCEGIELLHQQSEVGDGGRARILFYAMGAFLDERGIIDALKASANYMAANRRRGEADSGAVTQ